MAPVEIESMRGDKLLVPNSTSVVMNRLSGEFLSPIVTIETLSTGFTVISWGQHKCQLIDINPNGVPVELTVEQQTWTGIKKATATP